MGARGEWNVDDEVRLVNHLVNTEPRPTNSKDHALLMSLAAVERQLKQSGLWAAGPVSLFEVLNLVDREVVNCRVLRWLLDPLAPHGIGATTLRGLLGRLCQHEAAADLQDVDDVGGATVEVEERQDAGRTRADVVVHGDGWSIVIEAKIGAGEQVRQGERLEQLWPNATLVFLTRQGSSMRTALDDERWVRLTWKEIWAIVAQALADAGPPKVVGGSTARAAVRDYLTGVGHMEVPL